LGKAADVDPYDTGVALELVRALAAAGDGGGALGCGDVSIGIRRYPIGPL
jgi:hypothetical protein